ncbi:TM2 domain-containing protein [Psychroserpens damuponensis]|uniref:TM2 domain-containing protein n=1 Tax=Psychroserpens damuponensis TaxID=943936 RepID=UPI00058CBE4E|nr:TM2 domain-containing protein [Psychroserpens damuponensis]
MKFKFLLSFLLFFGAISLSHASFPVKRTVATVTTTNISTSNDAGASDLYSPAAKSGKDKWVGVALWFFLGVFAAHRWYYKKPVGWNILFIVTLGGLGVWAIIDLINMLTDNF